MLENEFGGMLCTYCERALYLCSRTVCETRRDGAIYPIENMIVVLLDGNEQELCTYRE